MTDELPRLTRNHDGDLLLAVGEKTTLVAKVGSPLWEAIVSGTTFPSVDEMAAVIRQLVQSLRKAAPGNEVAERAMAYLKKHGLQGSPFRILPATPDAAAQGNEADVAARPDLLNTPEPRYVVQVCPVKDVACSEAFLKCTDCPLRRTATRKQGV